MSKPNLSIVRLEVAVTQMAACLIASEAVRLLLGRGVSALAPYFLQIDAYRQSFHKGYLRHGNRNWTQQIKYRLLKNRLNQLGWGEAFQAPVTVGLENFDSTFDSVS